jgi:hypothetical protein
VAVTIGELRELVDSRIPENTKQKVDWVMKMFKEWLRCWRVRMDGLPKVLIEIEEFSANDLDYCLQFFLQVK